VKVIHECLLASFVLSSKLIVDEISSLLLKNNLQDRMNYLHICRLLIINKLH
jgi:hypothetical protein